MIGRLVLAAFLAGMAAGIIMAAIQHVRITPYILQAETYEQQEAAPAHSHDAGTPAHSHGAEAWTPADGWQRTFATTLTMMLAGAGFATMMAGVSLLTGTSITPQNGLIWGICGFLAVTLAPGAGLPPELPGMPAADTLAHQVWWVSTIAATGIGLYLIAIHRETALLALAIALIALPHIIGAPQAPPAASTVPAGLAAGFVSNTIAAAAIFWCLIGMFLGLALDRFSKETSAT